MTEKNEEYWTPRRRAVWAAAFVQKFTPITSGGVDAYAKEAAQWADLVAAWAPEEDE